LLLGVAKALRAKPASVGVDLLFVDGEDYGSFSDTTETLLGSRRYVRMHPNQRPGGAVVWDMVGDHDQTFLQEGYSLSAAPDFVQRVWRLASELGYRDHFPDQVRDGVIDDHLPLQKAGVRAICIIDLDYGPKNAWHHTVEDTRDKLSVESLARAAHVATALIRKGMF
jgi:hypothetical protein